MLQTHSERRRRRTDDVALACQYQLEQVVADFNVRSLVLIDASGAILAEAGDPHECTILSERAFELAREEPTRERYACAFRIDGERFVVAAAGSEKAYREVGVFRAILGIRRIQRAHGGR